MRECRYESLLVKNKSDFTESKLYGIEYDELCKIITVIASEIIKELYADNRAYIKQGNRLYQPIYAAYGYRLSPLLFNIYLEKVLRQWRRSFSGLKILIDELYFYILNFVDDQVMFVHNTFEIKFMLKRLNEHYHNWRLINISKTECMTVNSSAFPDLNE